MCFLSLRATQRKAHLGISFWKRCNYAYEQHPNPIPSLASPSAERIGTSHLRTWRTHTHAHPPTPEPTPTQRFPIPIPRFKESPPEETEPQLSKSPLHAYSSKYMSRSTVHPPPYRRLIVIPTPHTLSRVSRPLPPQPHQHTQ